MDAYWELSDFDIHTRQQGLENLLKSIETLSTDDNTEKVNLVLEHGRALNNCFLQSSSSQIDYTVSRLIKGLVSNRKCARIGYAATLGTVRHYPHAAELSTRSVHFVCRSLVWRMSNSRFHRPMRSFHWCRTS